MEFNIADGACRDSRGDVTRPVICLVDIDPNSGKFSVCYPNIYLGVGIATLVSVPIVIFLSLKFCRRIETEQITNEPTDQTTEETTY